MSTYQLLDCDLHDYLEIACLRGYRVQVTLLDGQELVANAITTRTEANKEEFLVLQNAEGEHEIRLDRIHAITPLDAHASFGRVELTAAMTR